MRITKARVWNGRSDPQSPRLFQYGMNHKRFRYSQSSLLKGRLVMSHTFYVITHHRVSWCFFPSSRAFLPFPRGFIFIMTYHFISRCYSTSPWIIFSRYMLVPQLYEYRALARFPFTISYLFELSFSKVWLPSY